mmetsp:Transcript_16112/g.36630  ORF Transcript_16112/g.36630 Transcript_16112/m.36630 type:complete len:90 (+) Transcript_16112:35-304(+)
MLVATPSTSDDFTGLVNPKTSLPQRLKYGCSRMFVKHIHPLDWRYRLIKVVPAVSRPEPASKSPGAQEAKLTASKSIGENPPKMQTPTL